MPSLQGAVPLETAALNCRSRSYAMYLFLVFCSMYPYFVVAVETDTNRQLTKTKFQEKKDQPGTEKQQYKPYGYSAKFRGDRCSYDSKIFPQRYTTGFPTTLQCYIFNPQRACARRVTVVILSVCHSFIHSFNNGSRRQRPSRL